MLRNIIGPTLSGLLSGPKWFWAYFCSGSKRFLQTQLSFCGFRPIIWQFSRKSVFSKEGCRHCFCCANFPSVSLTFVNYLFSGFPKHYKDRGFSIFLCFCCFKDKNKNDSWIFWSCVFSNNGCFVRINCFQKVPCWTLPPPFLYSGPSCQKGNYGRPFFFFFCFCFFWRV